MADWMKAYGFGISAIDARRHWDAISSAKGFICEYMHPQGRLMVFKTENDAQVCRNIMEHDDCGVGDKIIEIKIRRNGDAD